MFTFGIIALLGTAQADTPKKKAEKTEESKTKKSSTSTSKKPSTSKSKTTSKKSPPKKSTKKPASKTSVQKAPTSPPKRTTQHSPPKPTGKSKATGSPAKQHTGQERRQGTAHSPIGSSSSSNTSRPSYNRAPNNVERPTVGKEQQNTPNAHTPIGHKESNRTPTYDRAPENVNRPGVGKERDNAPTAHQPIGSGTTTNRPEKNRPTREPEGRIDREPPTRTDSNRPSKDRPTRNTDRPTNERIERHPPSKKESNRPEKNRPSKAEQTSNPRVDRTKPEPQRCNDCPAQAVSPGKSQHRNAYNGGFNTSTRRTNTTQNGGGSISSPFGFGLGTLSYSSDYVDGGAYNDGGLGLSLGVRLIPQFEIEGSYGRYTDSTLESSRNRLNRPLQLVGQVHPFPDAVVSPFISGGYVWNHIDVDDTYLADGEYKSAQQEDWLTGLALGAGVTFNVHQNIALELDGRLFQYNNLEYWDDAGDTATLVSMGVVVGF